MKVILETVVLDDHQRRALANHFGEPGYATRETVRTWVSMLITSALQDVVADYEGELESTKVPR